MCEIFSSALVLPTDLERLAAVKTQINEVMAQAPSSLKADIVHFNVHLAVHKLCVNIITHAYAGETGAFLLTLTLCDKPWRIEIATRDEGRRHFDPSSWPQPDLDDLPAHGLGMFLIRNLMDEVCYMPAVDCSRWRLVKRLALVGDTQPADADRNRAGSC